MSDTDTKQQCKVRYVYVEMILNKETKYDVVAGLFKGIVEKGDEKFILLHGLKNATAVLNTKFYNIMTIEALEDEYKNMTYLTSENQDQEMAFQMLEELNAMLLENEFGMKNDAKIIDIEKYKDVPDDYKDGKPINKDTATGGATGVGSFAAPGTRYSPPASGVIYSKSTTTKKEPTPSIFSRSKTKKPTKTALELMREKIAEIKAGTYEQELPETLGEEPAAAANADDDDDDDYNVYGYGVC